MVSSLSLWTHSASSQLCVAGPRCCWKPSSLSSVHLCTEFSSRLSNKMLKGRKNTTSDSHSNWRGWVCFARNVPHCSHFLKDPELWYSATSSVCTFLPRNTCGFSKGSWFLTYREALFVVNKYLTLHHVSYWITIFLCCRLQWTAFKVLRTTFCVYAPTNQEVMSCTGASDH